MNRFSMIMLAMAMTMGASAQTFRAPAEAVRMQAVPVHAAAADDATDEYVTWGYCIDNIQYSIGLGYSTTMSAAILINRDDMGAYRDADIVGIRIGVASQSTGVSVFMKTGNADNLSFDLPDVVKKNAGSMSTGFHEVMFDSPQKVTDQYIIVGYTATGENSIGFDGGTVNADACYLNVEGEWGTVYDQAVSGSWGSLCIQLLLAGEMPEREMKMEKVLTTNVEQNKPFRLEGVVSNLTVTPVTSYELLYSFNNGTTYTETVEANVAAMEADTFSIEVEQPLTRIGANAVMVKINKVNGEEDSDVSNNAVVQSINCVEEGCYFHRVIVAEESTSVNCGYCPRGIVIMSSLKARYPDRFIGIAIHSPAMGDDPMVVYDYDEYINGLYDDNALPNGIINRKSEYAGDPIMFDKYFEEELSRNGLAVADVEIESVSALTDNKIDVKVRTRFGGDYSGVDYRLAFVLIENQVESYAGQLNYFTGGEPMGGWENLPSTVYMNFDDVARGIWDFEGVEGSIPSDITKKTDYEYSYTMDLDAKKAIVGKAENLEVVALLVDRISGEILNADKMKIDSTVDGIADAEADDLNIYVNDGRVVVEGDYDSMRVYDVNGIMHDNTDLASGVYIVQVLADGKTFARKVVVKH